jgi:hypothetical protein
LLGARCARQGKTRHVAPVHLREESWLAPHRASTQYSPLVARGENGLSSDGTRSHHDQRRHHEARSSRRRSARQTRVRRSPDRIFDAWLDPVIVEQWLFRTPTNRIQPEINAKVGGKFSIVEHADGETIDHARNNTRLSRSVNIASQPKASSYRPPVASGRLSERTMVYCDE